MTDPTPVLTTRADIFIGIADIAAADVVLNEYYAQPADTQNFSVRLSASGDEPPTFYGASGPFTDEGWIAVRDRLISVVPSVRYYCRGLDRPGALLSNRLMESNSPTAVPMNGEFWSWAQSCQDAGLTQVVFTAPLGG